MGKTEKLEISEESEISEKAEESEISEKVKKATKEIQEANKNDDDKKMSDRITSWMDSTQITRISKQNVK